MTTDSHIVVTNDEGLEFSVVVVLNGESYGLNDCLTHNAADPLVEFYVGPNGKASRFVSRYSLDTLAEADSFGGLWLECSVPAWTISWCNEREAVRYARLRSMGVL